MCVNCWCGKRWSCLPTGTVIAVREVTFVELPPEDWDGHERYESPDAMYAVYSIYYKQLVGPDTSFKIIKFSVVLIA